MTAFELDSAGDIYVRDGSLARAVGADAVVQRLRTKLRFYLGEWYLNRAAGVPWFQKIFSTPADIENNERIIKKLILDDPDVVEIQEFSSAFEGATRAYTITFRVLTVFGPSGEIIISA